MDERLRDAPGPQRQPGRAGASAGWSGGAPGPRTAPAPPRLPCAPRDRAPPRARGGRSGPRASGRRPRTRRPAPRPGCLRRGRPASGRASSGATPCRSARRAATAARGSGPNRSSWQRERIVWRRPSGAAETRMTCERGGGSSRLLRSAFWADSFIVWASSITKTRRRASNGVPAISPIRSRTWSTRISGSARGRPVFVSHQPSASTRSGWRRKFRHTSSSGCRSASLRALLQPLGRERGRPPCGRPGTRRKARARGPARTGPPGRPRGRGSSCRRRPAPRRAARAAAGRARAPGERIARTRSWPRTSASLIVPPPTRPRATSPDHSASNTAAAGPVPSSLSQREGSCRQERLVAGPHAVVELPDLGLQAIVRPPLPHAGQARPRPARRGGRSGPAAGRRWPEAASSRMASRERPRP